MSRPSISVVICAYTDERWDELTEAVDSVRRQELSAIETIVVADHNPQLLNEIRNRMPSVVAVDNHEARGLSGARNSGLQVARGDVIAFLDDDAVAKPDWLRRLSERYTEDPAVVSVGGKVSPQWVSGRPAWFPEEFDWIVGCTYRGMPTKLSPVRNLIGANMSFRREAFQIGGFRSGIGRIGTEPSGCEETEFCIRLQRAMPSAVLLYEPRAEVLHKVPASRAGWDYARSRCFFEGRSKAVVARLQGTRNGLASERAYTFHTLPRGVARGLADTARGDGSGVARAATIVGCLAVTTAGYLSGKFLVKRTALKRGYVTLTQSEPV